MKRKTIYWIIAVVIVAALVLIGLRPKTVEVDFGSVSRGTLVVTVNEDGETRIREPYLISAPLAGRLLRVELEPGDPIDKDEVLAAIDPSVPGLLDARSEAEAQARVNAAQASYERTESQLEIAKADFDQAQRYHERDLGRLDRGNISEATLEDTEHQLRVARNNLSAAQSSLEIAKFELEQAKSALIYSKSLGREDQPTGRHFEIHSPIEGVVLRRFQESSIMLPAGERILEIGDPHDLEIRIDVLSQDAVRIRPGQRIIIEHWGGEKHLTAWVRRVEPSAFTKTSALGVDEQRVWVYGDFAEDDPAAAVTKEGQVPDSTGSNEVTAEDEAKALGDAYRIEARIVVWERNDVLKVPAGALFRDSGTQGDERSWAVYRRSDDGVAEKIPVTLGERNDQEAQVLEGLDEGDQVVLHPSDKVDIGTKLESR
ncbi:MAG: HlyD family efflux transporter periplasmic adaptor subunit [Verrucomicrobiae bacterium]|nr:HlyD family efflux transporter periplasmic adaptor subunit [Verrucomicrobiae bacterium]